MSAGLVAGFGDFSIPLESRGLLSGVIPFKLELLERNLRVGIGIMIDALRWVEIEMKEGEMLGDIQCESWALCRPRRVALATLTAVTRPMAG
jgi:hypothetical protein